MSPDMLTGDCSEKPFEYNPDEYAEDGVTVHWCLPGVDPEKRTLTATDYESGKLYLVDLDYGGFGEELDYLPTNERFNSFTSARASRLVKRGVAEDCPFCSESAEFTYETTRVPRHFNVDSRKRWEAEVLFDFVDTIADSCRDVHTASTSDKGREFPADIEFAKVVKGKLFGNPKLEILTNTDSLRYAYLMHSLPNWYSLAYAIAQNPWVEVEEVTEFESRNTRVLLSAKKPSPEEYDGLENYFRLLSQRSDAPYETKKP